MSDPYDDASLTDLYGTTYNYNTDGTPSCFVRGPGTQPANASVNETTEIYPTCFNHFFPDNKEFQDRRTRLDAADSKQRNFTSHPQCHGPDARKPHVHNTGATATAASLRKWYSATMRWAIGPR